MHTAVTGDGVLEFSAQMHNCFYHLLLRIVMELGPSRKGGAFLDLYMFRVLLLLLLLPVIQTGETVSADDSSLLIYD